MGLTWIGGGDYSSFVKITIDISMPIGLIISVHYI